MTQTSRRVASLRTVALLALCLAAASSAFAQPAPFEYRLSFPSPEHRWMHVEARFTGLPDGTAEIRMSRTSPGRYALHEFAKNVFEVTITDGAGRALEPTRPNLHQWNVTGHDGTVVVSYKVFGDRTDGTYLSVDAAHAHMNMPATVMFVRGQMARPARVTLVQPPGRTWKVATQLVPDRRPAGLHRAEHPLPDGQSDGVQQLHPPNVHRRRWREWPADDSGWRCITTGPTPTPMRCARDVEKTVREASNDLRRAAEVRRRRLHVPRRLPAMGGRRRHGAPQQHGRVAPRRAAQSRSAPGHPGHGLARVLPRVEHGAAAGQGHRAVRFRRGGHARKSCGSARASPTISTG